MGFAYGPTPDAHLCRTTSAGKCGRKCGPSDGHETFPGWLILALCG